MLEEIGVLDAIENLDEPRQRMRLELGEPALLRLEEAEDRGNPELGQSPVGHVADVGVDMLRQHALDLAKAEGLSSSFTMVLATSTMSSRRSSPEVDVRNSPSACRKDLAPRSPKKFGSAKHAGSRQ
ncbi:hypothetical protein [Bradyrhizobium zhanjiangense]|uniref:Uncharacterized protein n=1 Tax=Bradyrhizobium zhanjiangense TaxID=1325107 RepID=A0A4Q0SIS3_9BRAD|nr:hypothetical protein [Bradyrhizobium zhanjiangense]RXH39525.1 hypothetical protein XH94_16520 [Bradyrhizobium zhanjiangense]